MKINIIQEKINPLFNRKEVVLEIDSEQTPSHIDVKKILIDKFSASEDAIQIKKIQGKFGVKTFKVQANLYASKLDKEMNESKSKKQREAEKKSAESKPAQ